MQVRVVFLAVFAAAAFVVLGVRLSYLQVVAGESYDLSAKATRTREVEVPAQRGVIYDRDGEVLVNNVPALNITAVPAQLPRRKVAGLAKAVGADAGPVLNEYDAAFDAGDQYGSILVKENADSEAVTYVKERAGGFPGVSVSEDWVRSYPQGKLASHVLGYTGALGREDLKQRTFEGLPTDSIVGKSGVELAYEEELRGRPGYRSYNVDAYGRVVPEGARLDSSGRFVDGNGRPINAAPGGQIPDGVEEPVPGNSVTLTLDAGLQRTAEAELGAAINRAKEEGYSAAGGAVVAMDPRNGEVLAMASRPDFDPRLFVGGISGARETKAYEGLNSEAADDPLLNRAITAGQPAASTFKTFTGLAGLASSVIDAYTTYTDTGECWRPAGSSWGCWQSWRQNSPNYKFLGDHGTQNFAEALKDSNDKFFYQVADWIWNWTDDKGWLPRFYQRFGFGKPTGVDLPGETTGRVPTRAWERSFLRRNGQQPGEGYWNVGDWVNLSIGQGDLLVSPLQLARAYAAVQNGGSLVTPHVGREVRDQEGRLVRGLSPGAPTSEAAVAPSYLETASEGLRGVTERDGTAGEAFAGSELDVAGKSGTGELPADRDYVNWFVGWAEDEDRPLVVVAMVEGGGAFETGSEMTTAPAVRHVLESYYGVGRSPKDPYPTAGFTSPPARGRAR